jgi:lipoprotein NlpD
MGRIALVLVTMTLLACSGAPPAPVEVRRGEPQVQASRPASHTVLSGETLYAIAWRYGLDYRSLAQANRIASPYTIYPGQKLVLASKPPAEAPRKPAGTTAGTTAAKPASSPRRTVTKVSPKPDTNSAPAAPVSAWLWPSRGKVVRNFSGTVHKGIDISGESGDPVEATAAGRVVYAGSGIVGYGKLLIVKHNEVYLSAYGHNRRLLVAEGQSVKAGQKIAEMGSSATNSVKLHFEIRREGRPVDPKRLLPKP